MYINLSGYDRHSSRCDDIMYIPVSNLKCKYVLTEMKVANR